MAGQMVSPSGSEDASWHSSPWMNTLNTDDALNLDDLTQLLTQVCSTSIALITLCDRNRHWLLSQVGLSLANCINPAKLLLPELHELVVVPDILEDQRFSHYPLASHAPFIRFWAGVPLMSPETPTEVVGLVCVMDTQPQLMNHTQVSGLKILAHQLQLRLQLQHEIQQRRQLEQALYQSETYNQLILASMKDTAVGLLNPTGEIVNWQTQAKHPRDHLSENLIGQHFSCFYLPEAVRSGKPQQDLKHAIATGQFVAEDWRQRQDGSRFWASISITPLRDQAGRLQGFLKLQRDISDRRRAANLLIGQNRVLEMLATGATLETILTALIQTVESQSSELRCATLLLDTNQLCLRYITAPSLPKTYCEATDGRLVGPGAGSCGAAAFLAKPIFTEDIQTDPFWKQDKELALAHGLHACAAMPLLSPKRQVLGIFAVYFTRTGSPTLQDLQLIQIATHIAGITLKHKRDEEILRHSEAQYRQIVDTAQEGILVINPQEQISYVNQRLSVLLGYDSEALLGSSVLTLIHEADHATVQQLLTQHPTYDYQQHDVRFCSQDGSVRWTILSTSSMVGEGEQFLGTLGMITDITERKLAETALQAAHDDLEQRVTQRTLELAEANQELQVEIAERKRAEAEVRRALKKEQELGELKSRFITIASHEFRTPLSTILFSAGLLEKYGHKWAEERKLEHLQRIQGAVANMTQLLEEVLLIGKAEAAKLEFNPQPLDLEQFCRDLVEEIRLTTNDSHQIVFHCPTPFNHEVYLDEKLLQHIFRNLLVNAVKYSPKGGTISLELSYTNREIVFQVKDQGIGIPLADQTRLFEPFHRGTNVGNITGTGLGLSIVKSCVDVHQGEISIVSELGIGTTFIVHLPLTQ